MMPDCEPVKLTAGTPARVQRHREQRHRDALAGRQQHVELAPRGVLGHLVGEGQQLVRRVPHGGDDDHDVLAGRARRRDAVGHAADVLDVRDRRAAVLLDDDRHRARSLAVRSRRPPNDIVAAVAEPAAARAFRTWQSLKAVFTQSWRLASVALLQFPSGLPLGLVWIAVPAWLTEQGVDIKLVGLVHARAGAVELQVPVVAAPGPLSAPVPRAQARAGSSSARSVLLVAGPGAGGVSDRPDASRRSSACSRWRIAFASATQDIAIDAHAVEVLRKDEHGAAVGARLAVYRTRDVAVRARLDHGRGLDGLAAGERGPRAVSISRRCWSRGAAPEPESTPASAAVAARGGVGAVRRACSRSTERSRSWRSSSSTSSPTT